MNQDKKLITSLKDLGVGLLNDSPSVAQVKSFSTGSNALNKALGIGGWPEGKIIELFGVDSSGKTTLALHAVAECQKLEKPVIYIDLENTLNPQWAKSIGVDTDKLFIARPDNGEKTFELMGKILENHDVGLIVVDSVAALVPSHEFENSLEDQTVGLHARLMSKGLRVLQSLMINKSTTIIFINQVREKIGNTFIPVTTTTGGRALRYSACIRVEVKRCEAIKNASGSVLGFETKCIVVKNKYGSPLSIAKSAIYFDSGFDSCHELILELIEKKVINKKGSWLEYDGKNLAAGLINLRNKLRNDQGLFNKLNSLGTSES